MCVTESGKRIFIYLKDRSSGDEDEIFDKIEKQGLQSEVFKGVVPLADWGISGVLEEFPSDHEVLKN